MILHILQTLLYASHTVKIAIAVQHLLQLLTSYEVDLFSKQQQNMKFAANISTLCHDVPRLTDRFVHIVTRQDYRFTHVECQNPYDVPVSEWQDLMKQHPVSWSLINSLPLFNEWLSPTLPSQDKFKSLILDKAIEYANGLDCKRVHLIMNDVSDKQQHRLENEEGIVGLIDYASRVFEPHGITILLEPLSIRKNYYLRSYEKAIEITNQLKRPNVRVMLDIFHLQMLRGNLTQNIKQILPHTGHVQVSQAPLRDSPIRAGEISYPYVFKQLTKYEDVIGLEYFCDSNESFSWLRDFEDI